MKPWFFACALALIAAGTALAQESPPDGGVGGGGIGGGGGLGGGGRHGGHRGGNKGDAPDATPKPPETQAAVLDHAGYEAAWTQCHLNVDLMRRLDCYEKLHDGQEAALKGGHGGPPPH